VAADIVIGVLLALNLLLIAVVHVRRLRESSREQRAEQFRTRIEQLLAEHGPGTEGDTLLVRQQLGRFNELERPIAASMMIERLKVSSPEERERTLVKRRAQQRRRRRLTRFFKPGAGPVPRSPISPPDRCAAA
jgi:hypothetical protein